MKDMRHKLFCGKEKWSLDKADFTETTERLCNPARGWYRIYTFEAHKEPDFEELEYCLDKNETLALILIDIGSFQNRDLDMACIQNIRKILDFFVCNQKQIILRAAYDHEGRAPEREPSLFAQMLRHMTQVGEILAQYSGDVFVYQGLLMGNWGEMHTSRFLLPEQLRQLAAVLREQRGEGTFLAVRKPAYWRILNDTAQSSDMGLFDDGIFGSPSDLGTFGNQKREAVGGEHPWSREEELAFEEQLCLTVPNGGEAVYGEGYLEQLSQEQVLNDLGRMHITYLNSRHDVRLLECWKKSCYEGLGVWSKKSLYDYIGEHLGYRFWIKNATVKPCKEKDSKGMCRLELEIKNVGFANLYQEAALYLEWQDGCGNDKRKKLDCDMREWNSGSIKRIVCTIEAGEGALFLAASLKRNGQPLYFANRADEMGRVSLGCLKSRA